MPAVELEKLKDQLVEISWQFTRPEEFHRRLNDLLEFYSNPGYCAGSNIPTAKFIRVYHLPPQLVTRIEILLGKLGVENPSAGLALADELWKDDHLETRRLAAHLLGQIPLAPPGHVLAKLVEWCKPEEEALSLNFLLQNGSLRIRRDEPQAWLDTIEGWLENDALPYKKMGMQALVPLLADREFTNLPPIFRYMLPMLSNPHHSLFADLEQVVIALDARTPGETAYFLRQVIYLHPDPPVLRFVRRVMQKLSAATQDNLRAVVKEFSTTE
jgi:hypothetical protein